MEDLRITLVQPDIIWKNPRENLEKYSELLTAVTTNTDLLLFPEMFQTGFCTEPEQVAETMDGNTVRWMKRTAESLKCSVAGSLIIRDNRRFFNRIIYIDQFENLTWYDKRHLFTIAGEESKFTPGNTRLIVPLKGWQICFQICYDLRFPVWSRNQDDYDMLVYLASWPSERRDVWDTLLKARAIENQSYVAGVNRTGTDGNSVVHTGNSMILNPKGMIIGELPSSREDVQTLTLSWKELDHYRKSFPAWKDRDDFEIRG
jgi:predicted amidohydrolase